MNQNYESQYVQRAREDVPERTINRCTQYMRYLRYVTWYEEEAASRGVHVVRDETLPRHIAIVEVSDEDPTVKIWT
jgi:2-phosphoglycerate kinase